LATVITITLVTVDGTREAIQRILNALLHVVVVEDDKNPPPVVSEAPTVPVAAGDAVVNPLHDVGDNVPVVVVPVQNAVGDAETPSAAASVISNEVGELLMKVGKFAETLAPVGE
jgi:hypothetical protein